MQHCSFADKQITMCSDVSVARGHLQCMFFGAEGTKSRPQRRRERDVNGVEEVGNEVGMGRGYSPPQPTRGLGSVVSSPNGVRGRAPAEIELCKI